MVATGRVFTRAISPVNSLFFSYSPDIISLTYLGNTMKREPRHKVSFTIFESAPNLGEILDRLAQYYDDIEPGLTFTAKQLDEWKGSKNTRHESGHFVIEVWQVQRIRKGNTPLIQGPDTGNDPAIFVEGSATCETVTGKQILSFLAGYSPGRESGCWKISLAIKP